MSENAQYPETADIETSSDDYAARFAGPAGEWMLSVQENIVLNMLDGNEGARILDVGGGHGQLAVPLSDKGFDLTVLGSSDECSARIQKQVDAGKIKFQAGNILEMPFADDSFDVVISIRLLPHCEKWQALVGEMCRVAQKCVIVDYPAGQSLNCFSGALFGAKKKIEGNTRPYTLFAHAEVAEAFRSCGFAKRTLKKEFFVPMVVHRMLQCPALSGVFEGVSKGLGLTALWGSPAIAKFEECLEPQINADKRR